MEKINTAEKIGMLQANIKNVDKKVDELSHLINKIADGWSTTRINTEKLAQIEQTLNTLVDKMENATITVAEKFGMIYEDREEVRKDFIFVRNLRLTAEQTKKSFIKEITKKIVEYGAIAYIASGGIAKMLGQ